jgi:hypothetical protein
MDRQGGKGVKVALDCVGGYKYTKTVSVSWLEM